MNKEKTKIKTVVVSVLIGAAAFLVTYLTARIATYRYVHGTDLEQTVKIICLSLGSAVGLTALLWSAVLQIGIRVKKLAKMYREERLKAQTERNAYTASLFDMIDDEGNKEFFTLYGNKVKPGEDYGPGYIALRMAALICMFFTIGTGLIMVCMLLSVTV